MIFLKRVLKMERIIGERLTKIVIVCSFSERKRIEIYKDVRFYKLV